jgi:hypothetical protein
LESILRKVLLLWLATALVHGWLIFETWMNPQTSPFNDINLYGIWVDQMTKGHYLLGVNQPWVYPFVALVPMFLAKLIGGSAGVMSGWLILVFVLNAVGLSAIVDWGKGAKSSFYAAGFYLAYLAALGSVSIGRIDSVATYLALLGLVQLYRDRVQWAMICFTLGAWIKIWPVAAAVSAFIATKQRLKALYAAAGTVVGVLLVGLLLGGNQSIFSFVSMQGNRGIQVESPVATFWIWAALFKAPGVRIYFDQQLITVQVAGAFTSEVSTLMGLAMPVALAITVWLGWRAHRAGTDSKLIFAAMSLTAVLDLIVFNKVGSPQYDGWLAIPVMAGLLFGYPKWRTAVVGILAIGVLTNLIYPVFYSDLMSLQVFAVLLITLRNATLIAMLVWANRRLSQLATL